MMYSRECTKQAVQAETPELRDQLRLTLLGLDRSGGPLRDGRQPEIIREAIAKRVLALAAKRERNSDRLCEAVLTAMGILR
jgi:hypothetical protein